MRFRSGATQTLIFYVFYCFIECSAIKGSDAGVGDDAAMGVAVS